MILTQRQNRFRQIFFFFMLGMPIVVLLSIPRILIPFGIAYVFALLLRPLAKYFYSVSLKKKTLGVLVTLFLSFLFIYPFVQIVNTVAEEAHKIEYYIPRFESYLQNKYATLKNEVFKRFNYKINVNPVDQLIEYGQESTKAIVVYLPKIVTSLLEWGFIIPLFLFFILKDGREIRKRFLTVVPNNLVERTYYLFHQFNTKFGDYIFAKFIEAAIVGSIITSGLWIIKFPFAFLLGLIAAITNILPYIGPVLGFIPALIVGLVDQNPDTTLGAMILLYVIANAIDLALVFPILVSKIVNLHPMVVVVSVILGSQLGGAIGMIISIPLAAFLKLLFEEIYLELYETYETL